MKSPLRMTIVLFACFFAVSVQAKNSSCSKMTRVGIPFQSDQILCREGYVLGYNHDRKVADWVMYPLTEKSVSGWHKRKNYFSEDHEVNLVNRSLLMDYKYSGWDRGHFAPNASMDFTVESQKESFLLSNIAPQHPDLNQLGWRVLEDELRECAKTNSNGIFVVTGPIWSPSKTEYIGNRVAIPAGFFKAVIERKKPYRMAAWVMPNSMVKVSEVDKYQVSVDRIESATSFDLFSAVPDDLESLYESTFSDICKAS